MNTKLVLHILGLVLRVEAILMLPSAAIGFASHTGDGPDFLLSAAITFIVGQLLTLLPRFDFYIGDERVGTLKREFTFLSPAYDLDCCGWRVTGNWLEWDYQILRRDGSTAAVIRKELFHWTDTYTIETEYDEDALCALMVVLAIDADKCGSA